jgi:hypothetical protein
MQPNSFGTIGKHLISATEWYKETPNILCQAAILDVRSGRNLVEMWMVQFLQYQCKTN